MNKPTKPSGKITAHIYDGEKITVSMPPTVYEKPNNQGQPEVNIGLVSNIFVRQMHFKNTGDCECGHEHPFDHLTLLASGKLKVEVNGFVTFYDAPAMIYIKKDVSHQLTALDDDTMAYCVHGLRDIDKSDDIVSSDMFPNGVTRQSMELAKLTLKGQK